MSDSETESVDAVEVEAPKKKTRPPMSDDRRKQMLANLAKGRKTRAENLSTKRLEKEQEQVKKEQEHKCDFCGSQFKYKASKNKHMKTCKENPNVSNEVEDKPVEIPPKENVKVERKEKEIIETPIVKEEKKKNKKKVVYIDSDSSSDEEVVYKRRKNKPKVVFVDRPAAAPAPAKAPIQPRPLITEEQKQMILKKRQEEMRYAKMGREQEENANRIKIMSANMLRKNRF